MLRMRLGCKTPKAALIRSETPSQSGFPLVGVTGFEQLHLGARQDFALCSIMSDTLLAIAAK